MENRATRVTEVDNVVMVNAEHYAFSAALSPVREMAIAIANNTNADVSKHVIEQLSTLYWPDAYVGYLRYLPASNERTRRLSF